MRLLLLRRCDYCDYKVHGRVLEIVSRDRWDRWLSFVALSPSDSGLAPFLLIHSFPDVSNCAAKISRRRVSNPWISLKTFTNFNSLFQTVSPFLWLLSLLNVTWLSLSFSPPFSRLFQQTLDLNLEFHRIASLVLPIFWALLHYKPHRLRSFRKGYSFKTKLHGLKAGLFKAWGFNLSPDQPKFYLWKSFEVPMALSWTKSTVDSWT